MDKGTSQERSVRNKRDASTRVEESKVAAMQLQLLPPDVLRHILSRLSLKEVVRLSTLSHEWIRLRICHPDLVLTQKTFFGKTVAWRTYQHPETTKFITKVDKLLRPLWSTSTTTTTTLDKFVIKFCLGRRHKYHIDKWIKFSTASRSKHIALDFTMERTSTGRESDKYVFPLRNLGGPIGSCIKSLELGYVRLKLPPNFCGITNLTKLALNKVSISEADLYSLLLSCAFLESLSIEFCSLTSLCIRQELSRLQCLRVRYCHLEMIELHAPNLAKFEFDEYHRQIVLAECLKLSEATFVSNLRLSVINIGDFELNYAFPKLPTTIPHVHKLVALLNFAQLVRFSNTQTSFINLRHLNMNLEIFNEPYDTSLFLVLVNILQSAPLLEELELHLGRYTGSFPSPRVTKAAQGPQHHHLNSVYISGFCDALGLAEVTLYMLENATVLERMVVDPVSYGDPYTDSIYSASKAGSRKGASYNISRNRVFAKEHLDREEFGHILTIL
ncbi:uncharacterized protein LOC124702058 [Lolium rigidum]|uniref:uncharacterized protein LOC124702058 n=1 Tax=Lolium rigidum TaxID=89674 RepID=UPI001F5D8968|nr:uncharacterized protein LOC124702058 [Lolium rigidum]